MTNLKSILLPQFTYKKRHRFKNMHVRFLLSMKHKEYHLKPIKIKYKNKYRIEKIH